MKLTKYISYLLLGHIVFILISCGGGGGESAPAINLSVSEVTPTSAVLNWEPVVNATVYNVYLDDDVLSSYNNSGVEYSSDDYLYRYFVERLMSGNRYCARIEAGHWVTEQISLIILPFYYNHTYWVEDGRSSPICFTPGDFSPPTVMSITPKDKSVDVPLNTSISVMFSEDINPGTINHLSFLVFDEEENAVIGFVSYTGLTAIFTPYINFQYSMNYTVKILNSVSDNVGNAIGSDLTYTFATGDPDLVPPVVISTAPMGELGNVVSDVSISATFSEAMTPETLNDTTFILTDGNSQSVAGSVVYFGNTATFTPSAPLDFSMSYIATITTESLDIAGNPLEGDFNWGFTTWHAMSAAEMIDNLTDGGGCPSIGIDLKGNAIVVWRNVSRTENRLYDWTVWANHYTAGVGWGNEEIISVPSDTRTLCPIIGMDSYGNAIAAWSEPDSISVAHYSPLTGWSSPISLYTGYSDYLDIAVNANGNAMLVWGNSTTDIGIYSCRYDIVAGWGVTELVTADSYRKPKVVMDSNENVIMVWSPPEGVSANHYIKGVGWEGEQQISSIGANMDSVSISGDADGNAFVAWSNNVQIFATRFSEQSGWSTAVPIGIGSRSSVHGIELATDIHGNAFAVWYQGDPNNGWEICSNRYINGVGWNNIELIHYESENHLIRPKVAISPSGKTTVAWATTANVYARQFIPVQGWGDIKLLNTTFGNTNYRVEIVADSSENFITVWSEINNSIWNIWANRFQ